MDTNKLVRKKLIMKNYITPPQTFHPNKYIHTQAMTPTVRNNRSLLNPRLKRTKKAPAEIPSI
jgi:hypothetical protein